MDIFDFVKTKRKAEGLPVTVKPETKPSIPEKKEPVLEVKSLPAKSKISAGVKVTDIDGNVYSSVKIGTQIWTVENFKATRYNDGTLIPLVSDKGTWSSYDDNKKPGYCWYDDDKGKKEKYGALYNWYAVNTGKLAPKGWHVPTFAEWTELKEYLIANGYNWDGTKELNKIAKALAAKTDWDSDNYSGTIGNYPGKNNDSGFSALPGGCRYYNGDFYYIGNWGYWWSATESAASRAWHRDLFYGGDYLYRRFSHKGVGLSVRLLRD